MTTVWPSLDVQDYRSRLKAEVHDGRYAPHDDVTFCNQFVDRVAQWFGFVFQRRELDDPILAADMVKRLSSDVHWQFCHSYDSARSAACAGHLVIAGRLPLPGKAHGHVCIVAPEELMAHSDSWHIDVPMIANVGLRNFYGEPLSRAFAGPVDFRQPGIWTYLG